MPLVLQTTDVTWMSSKSRRNYSKMSWWIPWIRKARSSSKVALWIQELWSVKDLWSCKDMSPTFLQSMNTSTGQNGSRCSSFVEPSTNSSSLTWFSDSLSECLNQTIPNRCRRSKRHWWSSVEWLITIGWTLRMVDTSGKNANWR